MKQQKTHINFLSFKKKSSKFKYIAGRRRWGGLGLYKNFTIRSYSMYALALLTYSSLTDSLDKQAPHSHCKTH